MNYIPINGPIQLEIDSFSDSDSLKKFYYLSDFLRGEAIQNIFPTLTPEAVKFFLNMLKLLVCPPNFDPNKSKLEPLANRLDKVIQGYEASEQNSSSLISRSKKYAKNNNYLFVYYNLGTRRGFKEQPKGEPPGNHRNTRESV